MVADYLLDTNVLVNLIRDNECGRRINQQYNLRAFMTECHISSVTVGEMESLARQWDWDNPKLTAMRGLLGELIHIDIEDPAIYHAYAEIDSLSRAAGIKMGKNDLWIAATAMAAGLTLLTTDTDFDHLDTGLVNYVWIDPDGGTSA